MKKEGSQTSISSTTNPLPQEMTPNNTAPGPEDQTGPQSQMALPQAPQDQVPQNPAPQNQQAQASTAADASQPSQPPQTQPEPIVMQCCQKTAAFRRDCNCRVPQGPCTVPDLVFTHYRRECDCYSCQWLRESQTRIILSRVPNEPDGYTYNPTFAAEKLGDVLKTDTQSHYTNLELVHPVLLRAKPQSRWEWVFHSVNQNQLPFLADPSEYSGVLGVTLDRQGQWKALLADGTYFTIRYDTRPVLNELYPDYGYAPECSPYGPNGDSESKLAPEEVNPEGYVPQQAPNKSRQDSATQHNTTLFVGGIDQTVTDEEFQTLFLEFGQLNYVNRSHQTSAFVQFTLRRDALMAMRQMQGVPIKSCRLRISWGDPAVRNFWDFDHKKGMTPFKGHKYRQPQQPRNEPQHNPQQMPHNGYQNPEQQQWSQYQQPQQPQYVPQQNFQQMPYNGYQNNWQPQWNQYQQPQQPQYVPQQNFQQMPYNGYQDYGHQQWNQYQYQGFNNMPGPWYQQQPYQMPQMPCIPANNPVWYPGQLWYPGRGYQYPPPPSPPAPVTEQSPQPTLPQNAQSGQPSSLNPSAGSSEGVQKGKGPVVVSSDRVPNPSQQSHDQPAQKTSSPSSLESHQENGPVVISSDMVPDSSQQSHGEPVQAPSSESSFESHEEKASPWVSPDVVPNPSPQSHNQPAQRSSSASSLEFHKGKASPQGNPSHESTGETSAGDQSADDSERARIHAAELRSRLEELKISTTKEEASTE